MTSAPKFRIGTQFIPRGNKAQSIYTIVDIWQTVNSLGECVRVEYVCEHSLARQVITSRECETTVAMGIANMKEVTA